MKRLGDLIAYWLWCVGISFWVWLHTSYLKGLFPCQNKIFVSGRNVQSIFMKTMQKKLSDLVKNCLMNTKIWHFERHKGFLLERTCPSLKNNYSGKTENSELNILQCSQKIWMIWWRSDRDTLCLSVLGWYKLHNKTREFLLSGKYILGTQIKCRA